MQINIFQSNIGKIAKLDYPNSKRYGVINQHLILNHTDHYKIKFQDSETKPTGKIKRYTWEAIYPHYSIKIYNICKKYTHPQTTNIVNVQSLQTSQW